MSFSFLSAGHWAYLPFLCCLYYSIPLLLCIRYLGLQHFPLILTCSEYIDSHFLGNALVMASLCCYGYALTRYYARWPVSCWLYSLSAISMLCA